MVANTANLSSLSPSEIDALLPVPEPTLTTDFNVSPYYDDYDQNKDYYRILFKPGYAVQARELTQIQTLTQKQIDRFGRHVFKEGSIVIPGEFIIENDVDYVKVRDIDTSNSTVTINTFQDQTLVSANNGVQAYVIDTLDGTETNINTKTIYVRYLNSSNSNTQIKTFQSGDVLVCNAGTLLVSSNSSSIGKGSRFVIREGVYFAKQHFIRFPTQSVILDRYSTSPTCRVGFELVESIVNATDDLSLLDPALESSNYAAPGADRLKLTSILTVRDFNDTEGAPNYVELFKIKDGVVTELWQRTQYNILGDELAKRTLDESGDYYVRGLSIRLRENLDINNNGGLSPNGSANLLSVGVEPGLAYVKGFPVEIFGETVYTPVNKSTTFSSVTSQKSSVPMGNYLIANNYTGTISHDVGTTVFLRDAAQRRLANKLWAASSATGNIIGTAKVRTIEYDSSTLGRPDDTVAIYLTDIRMNGTNSFANVKGITATNFAADPVLENGIPVLKDTASDVLLYFAGDKGIKTIRAANGSPSLSLNFKKTSSVTITGGTFSVSGLTPPEEFPFGSVTLAAPDKREIILTIDSDVTANTGRGTLSAVGNVITTSVTGGFNNLNNGDKIQFSNNNYAYLVASIASGGTSLTIAEPSIATIASNTWSKVYKNGDVIDLTTKGYFTGAVRTVNTTDSTLSFNLGEVFNGTGKISYPVKRAPTQEIKKVLKANCVVGINTSNSIAGTTGPYSLGVSDLLRIRSITNVATSANLISLFTIDNGQRDAFYDHARLIPKSALPTNLNIRVVMDYFEPDFSQGKGFFSGCVNENEGSYPVDDTNTFNGSENIRTEDIPVYSSPKTGRVYDLRDHLDFRPVKAPTITYTTSTSSYRVNPSNDAAFSNDNGLRLPVPSSEISFDYSHFLPRRDILVMDKNKNIFIVEGTPSTIPTTPIVPDDAMLLASIYVSEYPSLARNYAKQIGREDLASIAEKQTNLRFTMRDIGILKRRIENLEYYSSLNLLQKSALDLNIIDGDGNNRFKNGIFVDNYANHLFGQTDSPDYRIVVDKNEKSIRPMYTAECFYYDYLEDDIETNDVQKTENLITLPYTEGLFDEQAAVTSYRNIELSSYRFVGTLDLQPDIDVWVDTDSESLPDEQIKIGPSADNLPQNTVDYDFEKIVTGYKVGSPVGKGNGKVSRNYGRGGTGTAIPQDYFGKTSLVNNSNSPNDQPVYAIQQITETTTTTTYSYDEEIVTEGPRLVDISIVPYIRPQTIDVWGRGLKRATRVYIFFDGENMSQYAAPMTKAQYDLTPDERRKAGFVPQYGAPLDVDADGNVYVALELPKTGKKFRVGQKEVVITDSPTNSIDATTYSKGYFVASGLTKIMQGRVITTGEITSSVDVDVARRNENVFLGYLDNPSCSAYSFVVKAPPEDEGMFLTSIDLFFARKHPTLGVWVEIRAMDNAGGITRTQVPYSEIWKTADEIVISEDGYTNPTNFKFKCPIFLNNDVQYAFVIHTEGLNPDTYLWIARLGETDVRPTSIGGGTKYNSRPLNGTFYTTNNNRNWNMVDDIDLKIKFYRANFDTSKTGVAIFGNEPVERLLVDDASTFTGYGEPVISYYRLSLSGNTDKIAVGDFLVGLTSGANSKINAISGSVATVSNTNYISGESVLIRYGSNAVSSTYTSDISSISYGGSQLSKYSVYRGNVSIDLKGSNGLYKTNEYITGSYTGHRANVAAILNYRYSKISFEPSYLKFRRNILSFDMKTTSNATSTISNYFPIVENDSYFFDTEQAIYSRSNEVTNLSGQRSNRVKFTLGSSTNYLSPVIDITKTRSAIIDNLINANTTYGLEQQPSGGELLNKYISRVVTLAEGQDAEDLNVYLTVYRPPTTDVLVWCKLLNANDPDTIQNAKWIPMEVSGTEAFSSLTNTDDFREVKYVIPESYLTGLPTDNSPGGEVQYTNSQGVKFTGFKYFAIKVGLAGINSAVVPRVLDLRAVALQI